MRTRKMHKGNTMIEVLIAGLMALLSGSALIALVQTSYNASAMTMGQNNANTAARAPIDTLADQLRAAQSRLVGSSYQVFAAAAASDVTYYSNSTTGDTTRFWLDTTANPPALKMTQTINGTPTTTVILSGVTSLQFNYYKQKDASYTAGSDWQQTANPPAASDLPLIGAVQIQATVTINGYTRQISSFVRLRNSPYIPSS